MKPPVSRGIRQLVSRLVGYPPVQSVDVHFDDRERLLFESAVPDIFYFQHQTRLLAQRSVRQFVVIFKDDGPLAEPLPVLVQVPDLFSPHDSYNRLLESLRKSNLPLESVESAQAQEIFIDRLSEFLVAASASPTHQLALTSVHSNRSGDTVLCAKGYFTSTGLGFGISTPAQGKLTGRYSFGIIDSGAPRFDGVVWTCPATVPLNLP